MNAAAAFFLGFLLPLAALWFFVLRIRPAIARARVECEATAVRNRVMDGVLAGEIDSDDQRATDLVRFSEFLAGHSRELSMIAAFSAAAGMAKAGVDVRAELDRASAARKVSPNTTDAGARRIQEAERELDAALARFLVNGSTFWWILGPAQGLLRFARSQHLATPHVDPSARPGELATEVREASRGRTAPPPMWTVHGRRGVAA